MTLEECASQEEYWYSKWLDRLVELGYVASYEYQVPIPVIDEVRLGCIKLNALNYTADFKVKWLPKAYNMFYLNLGNVVEKAVDAKRFHFAQFEVGDGAISFVDVKGKFAGVNNNSAITFPILQKAIYKLHDIYVQKIVPLAPLGLFNYTFTPAELMVTKKGKERKLNFNVRLCESYVDECKNPPVILAKVKGERKFTVKVGINIKTGVKGKSKSDETDKGDDKGGGDE